MATRPRVLPYNNIIILEVELAALLGDREAAFLNFLIYRIQTYQEDKCEEKFDGDHYWYRATMAEMIARYFPFISEDTLRRAIQKLEKEELIFVREAAKGDKNGSFYTVNEEQIALLKPKAQENMRVRLQAFEIRNHREKKGGNPSQNATGQDVPDTSQNATGTRRKMLRVQEEDPSQNATGTRRKMLRVSPFSFSIKNQDSNTDSLDQTTAEEDDENSAVCCMKNELISLLETAGIEISKANELVCAEDADLDNIRHQVAAMKFRETSGLTNQAGYLVKSIKIKRPLPSAYLRDLERKAKAERKQAQANQQQASKAETSESNPLDAKIWAFEFSLSDEEKATVDALALDQVLEFHRPHIKERLAAGNRKFNPAAAQVWDSTRKAVLLEMMQTTEGSQHNG